MDVAEAGETASRPSSALPTGVESSFEAASDQPMTEAASAASPQACSEFQLPPDIADPPERLCSAAVQVRSVRHFYCSK